MRQGFHEEKKGQKLRTPGRDPGRFRGRATEANPELREEQAKTQKAATPVAGRGGYSLCV